MFEMFLKDTAFVQRIAKIMKGQSAVIFKMFMKDPQKFAEELGKLGVQGRKEFREAIDKAREKYEIFTEPGKALEKAVNKATTKVQKEAEAKAKATMKGDSDQSSLSSSWLVHGLWEPVSPLGGSGDLTITTKTGDSYTYPGVPKAVWEAMKLATGRNGSGAGSVFWTMFLHSFKKSTFGQLHARVFKLAGVKSMSPTKLAKLLGGK